MNILLLGIGNILFQDEGIGAHFIHYMDDKYEFESAKSTINIVDGGTLAQRLIPLIVKYDHIIVVDCVEANNAQAGDVFFFDFNNAPAHINWQGSAHEVEMLQTLKMIQMNGDLPTTHVLGVVPKRVADDTTFELSSEIVRSVATMEFSLLEHLKSLDIQPKSKDNALTIQEMANISFKREIINGPKI
jgi:hydrogenase maturation protease